MIDLFSVIVELLLSFCAHRLTKACVARSGLTARVTYPRNTATPRPAFTRLVRGAAIRLISSDLCHTIISLTIIVFFGLLRGTFGG